MLKKLSRCSWDDFSKKCDFIFCHLGFIYLLDLHKKIKRGEEHGAFRRVFVTYCIVATLRTHYGGFGQFLSIYYLYAKTSRNELFCHPNHTVGNIFTLYPNLAQRIQNLALTIHLYWVSIASQFLDWQWSKLLDKGSNIRIPNSKYITIGLHN